MILFSTALATTYIFSGTQTSGDCGSQMELEADFGSGVFLGPNATAEAMYEVQGQIRYDSVPLYTGPMTVIVGNDTLFTLFPQDRISISVNAPGLSGVLNVADQVEPADALDSQELPTGPLDVNAFSSRFFGWEGVCNSNGTVDAIEIAGAPGATFEERVETMVDTANERFGSPVITESGPVRRRLQTVQNELAALLDLAIAQGCAVDADDVEILSGTFSGNGFGGETESGPLSNGSLRRGNQTFGFDLPDGTHVGRTAFFSTYDFTARRMLASGEDDTFAAGILVRQSGLRGVFLGLTGTCDTDPATALGSWMP